MIVGLAIVYIVGVVLIACATDRAERHERARAVLGRLGEGGAVPKGLLPSGRDAPARDPAGHPGGGGALGGQAVEEHRIISPGAILVIRNSTCYCGGDGPDCWCWRDGYG